MKGATMIISIGSMKGFALLGVITAYGQKKLRGVLMNDELRFDEDSAPGDSFPYICYSRYRQEE
jgi:hypothetical protein